MSTRHWQFRRPDPMKPFVHKKYDGGMWWASVRDSDGKTYADCFFAYEEALTKAYEYASMIKENTK